MKSFPFYSVRMHATARTEHLSGAEKIVNREDLDCSVKELLNRAMSKDCSPDRISITIDALGPEKPRSLAALDVVLMSCPTDLEARAVAKQVLVKTGVAEPVVLKAYHLLGAGASSGGRNMRGALIMNAKTGERLEPDPDRGVRASRFDWSQESGPLIQRELEARGLGHFRTREALALATKIAHGPGVLAELCWSDDPDYTAGYVAALSSGYFRFPFMKQPDDGRGGRAIFIEPGKTDVETLIRYLESEPVLIEGPIRFLRYESGARHV